MLMLICKIMLASVLLCLCPAACSLSRPVTCVSILGAVFTIFFMNAFLGFYGNPHMWLVLLF